MNLSYPNGESDLFRAKSCRRRYFCTVITFAVMAVLVSACGHKVIAVPSLNPGADVRHNDSDPSGEISRDDAVLIALNSAHVNEAEVTFLNIEKKTYRQEELFEIQFTVLSQLYTCKVRCSDGMVLEQSTATPSIEEVYSTNPCSPTSQAYDKYQYKEVNMLND